MTIQRSIHLWGSAIALASGLAFTSATSVSACIYSSLGGSESGSSILSLQNLRNQLDTNNLWRLGILATSLATIGGGIAFDWRRQRQSAIAAAIKSAESVDAGEWDTPRFTIPISPESLAPSSPAETPKKMVMTR